MRPPSLLVLLLAFMVPTPSNAQVPVTRVVAVSGPWIDRTGRLIGEWAEIGPTVIRSISGAKSDSIVLRSASGDTSSVKCRLHTCREWRMVPDPSAFSINDLKGSVKKWKRLGDTLAINSGGAK